MDYPRYTVFNRYVFGKYVDEGYVGHTFEKYKNNISLIIIFTFEKKRKLFRLFIFSKVNLPIVSV